MDSIILSEVSVYRGCPAIISDLSFSFLYKVGHSLSISTQDFVPSILFVQFAYYKF